MILFSFPDDDDEPNSVLDRRKPTKTSKKNSVNSLPSKKTAKKRKVAEDDAHFLPKKAKGMTSITNYFSSQPKRPDTSVPGPSNYKRLGTETIDEELEIIYQTPTECKSKEKGLLSPPGRSSKERTDAFSYYDLPDIDVPPSPLSSPGRVQALPEVMEVPVLVAASVEPLWKCLGRGLGTARSLVIRSPPSLSAEKGSCDDDFPLEQDAERCRNGSAQEKDYLISYIEINNNVDIIEDLVKRKIGEHCFNNELIDIEINPRNRQFPQSPMMIDLPTTPAPSFLLTSDISRGKEVDVLKSPALSSMLTRDAPLDDVVKSPLIGSSRKCPGATPTAASSTPILGRTTLQARRFSSSNHTALLQYTPGKVLGLSQPISTIKKASCDIKTILTDVESNGKTSARSPVLTSNFRQRSKSSLLPPAAKQLFKFSNIPNSIDASCSPTEASYGTKSSDTKTARHKDDQLTLPPVNEVLAVSIDQGLQLKTNKVMSRIKSKLSKFSAPVSVNKNEEHGPISPPVNKCGSLVAVESAPIQITSIEKSNYVCDTQNDSMLPDISRSHITTKTNIYSESIKSSLPHAHSINMSKLMTDKLLDTDKEPDVSIIPITISAVLANPSPIANTDVAIDTKDNFYSLKSSSHFSGMKGSSYKSSQAVVNFNLSLDNLFSDNDEDGFDICKPELNFQEDYVSGPSVKGVDCNLPSVSHYPDSDGLNMDQKHTLTEILSRSRELNILEERKDISTLFDNVKIRKNVNRLGKPLFVEPTNKSICPSPIVRNDSNCAIKPPMQAAARDSNGSNVSSLPCSLLSVTQALNIVNADNTRLLSEAADTIDALSSPANANRTAHQQVKLSEAHVPTSPLASRLPQNISGTIRSQSRKTSVNWGPDFNLLNNENIFEMFDSLPEKEIRTESQNANLDHCDEVKSANIVRHNSSVDLFNDTDFDDDIKALDGNQADDCHEEQDISNKPCTSRGIKDADCLSSNVLNAQMTEIQSNKYKTFSKPATVEATFRDASLTQLAPLTSFARPSVVIKAASSTKGETHSAADDVGPCSPILADKSHVYNVITSKEKNNKRKLSLAIKKTVTAAGGSDSGGFISSESSLANTFTPVREKEATLAITRVIEDNNEVRSSMPENANGLIKREKTSSQRMVNFNLSDFMNDDWDDPIAEDNLKTNEMLHDTEFQNAPIQEVSRVSNEHSSPIKASQYSPVILKRNLKSRERKNIIESDDDSVAETSLLHSSRSSDSSKNSVSSMRDVSNNNRRELSNIETSLLTGVSYGLDVSLSSDEDFVKPKCINIPGQRSLDGSRKAPEKKKILPGAAAFLCAEAEVSRDGSNLVSSDEDENPKGDVYDGSFVDDDLVTATQANVDMHEVYLKSVRSPIRPNMIPRTTTSRASRMAVCSQIDYDDDEEYADSDDSFVVSNDCLEFDTQADGLRDDGNDTLMAPRKSSVNNRRKRKRIMMVDSSSDDSCGGSDSSVIKRKVARLNDLSSDDSSPDEQRSSGKTFRLRALANINTKHTMGNAPPDTTANKKSGFIVDTDKTCKTMNEPPLCKTEKLNATDNCLDVNISRTIAKDIPFGMKKHSFVTNREQAAILPTIKRYSAIASNDDDFKFIAPQNRDLRETLKSRNVSLNTSLIKTDEINVAGSCALRPTDDDATSASPLPSSGWLPRLSRDKSPKSLFKNSKKTRAKVAVVSPFYKQHKETASDNSTTTSDNGNLLLSSRLPVTPQVTQDNDASQFIPRDSIATPIQQPSTAIVAAIARTPAAASSVTLGDSSSAATSVPLILAGSSEVSSGGGMVATLLRQSYQCSVHVTSLKAGADYVLSIRMAAVRVALSCKSSCQVLTKMYSECPNY